MSLDSYIKEHRQSKFQWGLTDCIHFIGKGIRAQGIEPFDHEDNYSYRNEHWAKKAYAEFLRKHKVRSVEELFDKLYTRVDYIPVEGSIVCRDAPDGTVVRKSFGFVSGRHGVYLDVDGLKFVPLDPEVETYWMIHE